MTPVLLLVQFKRLSVVGCSDRSTQRYYSRLATTVDTTSARSQTREFMTNPHKIRLRGPWPYCLPDGSEGTQKMPSEWAGQEGRVVFKRRFNWLAALEPSERVWLVFTEYGGTGPAHLNDSLLGKLAKAPAEFDITEQLKPVNELSVELSFDDGPETKGLHGYVQLEVRNVTT